MFHLQLWFIDPLLKYTKKLWSGGGVIFFIKHFKMKLIIEKRDYFIYMYTTCMAKSGVWSTTV